QELGQSQDWAECVGTEDTSKPTESTTQMLNEPHAQFKVTGHGYPLLQMTTDIMVSQ
ncbi:hypothetical protein BaRGS_00030147, partial [Batillaria attramentaria]